MLDTPDKLLLGLAAGMLLGVLLHRGRVATYGTIVRQLLLVDWTVARVLATAVVVGALGVHLMGDSAALGEQAQPLLIGGLLVGGVLFGVGLALLGYCPGTCLVACGAGRRDALVGLLGMNFGAAAFVAAYDLAEPVIFGLGNPSIRTLGDVLQLEPAWLIVAALVAAAALLVALAVRQGPSRRGKSTAGLRPAGRSPAGPARHDLLRRLESR